MSKNHSKSLDKTAKQYSPGSLRLFGFLSLLLTGFLIYSGIESQRTFPPFDKLSYSEGIISESKKDKYGITFTLAGGAEKYRYFSKGRAMGVVWEAISTGSTAKVGFDPYEDGGRTVYELYVDGRLIRSYAEIQTAYRDDNNLIYWMAPAFFLVAVFLFWMAHTLENYLEEEEAKQIRRDAGFGD